MALFGRNKEIGGHIRQKAEDVFNKSLKDGTITKIKMPVGPVDVTNYFIGVGFGNRGDIQSYLYEAGSRTSASLKVDLVALAAACAGAPVPETPIFAEVGGEVTVEKTKANLLVLAVGPKELTVGTRRLTCAAPVTFLAMYGYRFNLGLALTAEVGVKAPDIPDMPDFGGGGLSSDEPNTVESGTYAELCSFEVGAKASIAGRAGISGQRMYVSDTAPTFLPSPSSNNTKSTRDEVAKVLTSVLEHGDKKTQIKEEAIALFTELGHPELAPEKGFWQAHISGGNIATKTIVEQLQKLRGHKDIKDVSASVDKCNHHIKVVLDYQEQALLRPYCFASLWGMKPEASAGISASATASVKTNVGVASGGGEASVTVQGPSIETALKFTYYRFQYGVVGESATPPLLRMNAMRNLQAPAQRLAPSQYIITTQDTKITYGQLDMTLLGIEGKIELGVSQGVVGSERSKEAQGKKKTESRFGEAQVSGSAKLSPEEIAVSGSASAAMKRALNFMHYDSAVAVWMPPARDGSDKEKVMVPLGTGTGWAFGTSADAPRLAKHYQRLVTTGRLSGYFMGLAGCIGVTPAQLKEFLKGAGDMIEIFGEDARREDPQVAPDAFLIEATFAAPDGREVEARWVEGRWVLGPLSVLGTLRDALIPKLIDVTRLQAIRLRYRRADAEAKARTRFSLGFKYIVSVGIKYESIENAGSESIINLYTRWYNAASGNNDKLDMPAVYEAAVPQVALLHQ